MTVKLIENSSLASNLALLTIFSRQLGVLRLDKNDPLLSGNKFFKLQPWLQQAHDAGAGLLSCGGAYSNHLHALAAAGARFGIQTAGLVRGLAPAPEKKVKDTCQKNRLTITLQDCVGYGMQLIPVTRQVYARRYEEGFAEPYLKTFRTPMLWVPEGGTSVEAVQACEQIGTEINRLAGEHRFDALWLAVGSGGTLAGIARSLTPAMKIRAVPVLKDYRPVKKRVEAYLTRQQGKRICWVEAGWYRGFGLFKQDDVDRQLSFEQQTGIPLDPVYTAKVMRRMFEAYRAEEFLDEKPLMLHTGGLQGRRSIPYC